MSIDMIRFDVLVQEALRGVVRKVLAEVARTGLPGEHHFYVTFDTTHPSVRVSSRVRARYPEEMTIVLQHQFWDLTATDTYFEVGLSFGGIPEKLVIPYVAVKGFFDPSVQFGLQFDVAKDAAAADDATDAEPPGLRPATAQALPPMMARPAVVEPEPVDDETETEDDGDEAAAPTATVVSLDQFRKKT